MHLLQIMYQESLDSGILDWMSRSYQKPDKMISRSWSWLILGLCPLTPDPSDRQIWGFVDFTRRSLGSGANWVGEQNQRNPQYAKIRRQWISVESEVWSHFQLFHSQIKVRMDQTNVIKSPDGHQSYVFACIPWSTELILICWYPWFLFLADNHKGCQLEMWIEILMWDPRRGFMEKLLTKTFSGGLCCTLSYLGTTSWLACNQCDATFMYI